MKLRNINKKYGDKIIYENFSAEFSDGEICCILGENGCGKTTLLNIMAGLTDYEGEADKLRCAYIFQSPRLVPNLTVYGNLRLVCNDGEKINSALASAGLADEKNSYPRTLSGGQAKRVAVLRAFLYEAEAYLMDEPFSSLDLKSKIALMDEFREAWSKNKRCTVFVTHDIDEALYFADRIIVLKGGEAVADFPLSGGKRGYGANLDERDKIMKLLIN